MTSVLISAGALHAQSMKVVYQEQLKMPDMTAELGDDPAIAAAVAAQLGKMNTAKTMALYYNNGASLYEELKSLSDAQQGFENSSTVQIRYMGGGGCRYKDLKKKESISQEYIMDKSFLITEPLQSEWQLSAGEKKVGKYMCKKAVNSNSVTAWYCPDIPVGDGPGLYHGLPGLILEIEEPSNTIVMQSIEFTDTVKDKIRPPKTGKKANRDEFNRLRTQKMEEQGLQKGNGISIIKM
jgi:GLPGLI family protein